MSLAHVLINQLSFDCGYGSASLRERLYCDFTDTSRPMQGFLIYTASGDSEGTMGGLVRQGKRKPLVECEPLAAPDLTKIYSAIWNECLFKPYGALTCKQVEPSDIVKNGSRKAANSSIEGWSRYLDRTRRLNNAALPWIEKGLQWLSAGPGATVSGKSLSVPYAERVHGDLNCRNVFFAKEEPAILFIDFPNVRPASLATDFVRTAHQTSLAVVVD